jgi:hypothetical protein
VTASFPVFLPHSGAGGLRGKGCFSGSAFAGIHPEPAASYFYLFLNTIRQELPVIQALQQSEEDGFLPFRLCVHQ